VRCKFDTRADYGTIDRGGWRQAGARGNPRINSLTPRIVSCISSGCRDGCGRAVATVLLISSMARAASTDRRLERITLIMARPKLGRPTDGELMILKVLWHRGGSTVRQVHAALQESHPTGYTPVLKLLQIMTAKGLVTRDDSQRPQIYHPAATEAKTKRQLIKDLVDRVFGGSAKSLVMHTLATKKSSEEELAAIRDEIEKLRRAPKND
jgi:predicted transcriptional regulator